MVEEGGIRSEGSRLNRRSLSARLPLVADEF
jgi:hypothetical protein